MKLITLKPKIRIGYGIDRAGATQVEVFLLLRLRNYLDRNIQLPMDMDLHFHIQNQKFRSRGY
jgi:hypothetical protein